MCYTADPLGVYLDVLRGKYNTNIILITIYNLIITCLYWVNRAEDAQISANYRWRVIRFIYQHDIKIFNMMQQLQYIKGSKLIECVLWSAEAKEYILL